MLCLAKGTIPFLPVRHLRLGAGNIPIIPHFFSCGCHLPMGQSLLNVLHVNPVACSIIPTCDESALSPVLGAPCERKPRDSGFTPRHWPQPMVKRASTALQILSHTCHARRAASNTIHRTMLVILKVCPKRLGKRIEIGIRPVTRAPNIHIHTSAVWRLLSHTTATATLSAAQRNHNLSVKARALHAFLAVTPGEFFCTHFPITCARSKFLVNRCVTFQVASSSYPKVSNSELPAACRMPWW